jgi:hypothetical protein
MAQHWHCTDHSSFDAFLHDSHADISDTAWHSWNGTAQSSSANTHWLSVVIVCYTQSCRGNDINDAYGGNDCNDGNDDNDDNDNNGTTNSSFFITLEEYCK